MEVETQNNTFASETKIDISFDETEKHRKSICRILVSQYIDDTEYGSDDYVVTCSEEDKSVLGWSIKENGSQPDVYFKIDKIECRWLDYSVLSKKILLLRFSDSFLGIYFDSK
jgi:hypothetical protein